MARERIQSHGRVAEVIDIKPENPTSDVPILIAPGWGETGKVFEGTLRELYRNNRRTIMVTHPRWGGEVQEKRTFPVAQARRVETILAVLDEKQLEQVDIIAHSQGTLDATIAAYVDAKDAADYLKPPRIRNLVLVNPGGMMGEDNWFKLVKRFALDHGKRSVKRWRTEPGSKDALNRVFADAVGYLSNPARAAILEPQAISHTGIYDMLQRLHEFGIGVAVVYGVNDPVFPIETMISSARSRDDPRLSIDGFYTTSGDHVDLHINPKKYTSLFLNALKGLEYKKSHI